LSTATKATQLVGNDHGPKGCADVNALAGQTVKPFTAKVTAQALTEVGDLIESGNITLVIDRAYPLTEAQPRWNSSRRGAPRAR
jgi:hypothetical protein